MTEPSQPRASVVIPTFNRKDLLRDAIRSAMAQSVPVEVIVVDDGSPDGTGEMVRAEFPHVRYENLGSGNGPSVVRNHGIRMATCAVCFPIDDDAVFVSPRTIEQTLGEFEEDKRVGAVGIPFINVRKDLAKRVLQRADGEGIQLAHAFVGCAHAVRRDVFLAVGGYREHFFYMGEEGDVCLRMLAAGYVTRLGRADPMHHFESPSRVHARADFYGRRNDILYTWHNVPAPAVFAHMAGATLNGLIFGLRCGRSWRMVRGLASGYAGILGQWGARRPVSREVYRLARELKRRGAVPLAEVESRLPPMQSTRPAAATGPVAGPADGQ
jgi:GT2 family glycosyltransferase